MIAGVKAALTLPAATAGDRESGGSENRATAGADAATGGDKGGANTCGATGTIAAVNGAASAKN